jgi:hypothetical protein
LHRRRFLRRKEPVLVAGLLVFGPAFQDDDDFLAAEHGRKHGLPAVLEAGVAGSL